MQDVYYTYYKMIGNRVFLRYKKGDDPTTHQRIVKSYNPILWEVDHDSDSGITDIHQNPVKPKTFENIKEAKNYVHQMQDIQGSSIQGNSRYDNQMVIEMFDGQMPPYKPNAIRGGIIDIEVVSKDGFPVPHEAKWPIDAITVYDTVEKRYYVLSTHNYKHNPDNEFVGHLDVVFKKYETEEELLMDYVTFFKSHNFDYVTGWNTEGFDTPYIYFRISKLLGEALAKSLSPFNMVHTHEKIGMYGKKMVKVKIIGVPDLDYMALYKKHTFNPRDSYKLDHIGHVEVDTRKIDYSEAQSLWNLAETNPQKYLEYNIYDVQIVKLLDDKLKLIELTFTLAYYSLSNFEDTLGTTQIWEKLVAKYLYNNQMVPYFRQPDINPREFEGAYVKKPEVGRHEWVLSLDLNSLYPHIEMQYNIGPETRVDLAKELSIAQQQGDDELVESIRRLVKFRSAITVDDLVKEIPGHLRDDLKKINCCMAANGQVYRLDRMSFFSAIKRELYNERKVNKKKMLDAEQRKANASDKVEKRKYEDEEAQFDNLQMAQKILLNGGYGALANENFIYYMVENAEAITLSGQLVNRYTSERMQDHLRNMTNEPQYKFWVYSDTDSMYLSLRPVVDMIYQDGESDGTITDKLDAFCNKAIIPRVEQISQDITDRMNAYEQKMKWGREIIAKSAIWVAKKRYAASVIDSEGVRYKEPKTKIMGLESVKSSTPEWSRDALKASYKAALTGTEGEVHDIVRKTREAFMAGSVTEISIPRGVTNVDKYKGDNTLYKSGTPKAVKGVLLHNYLLDKLGVTHIAKIEDDSKIRYVELKEPNPLGCNALSFDTYFPDEFSRYESLIDRELMFEKAFISPLKLFLDSINWTTKKIVRVTDFFV